MEKVLIITYYWPPSGGAGVQRWLKLTKYLAMQNIEVHVISVDPQYASYLQKDQSLLKDVHPSVKVHHTQSFEPINYYAKIVGKSKVPTAGFSNVDNNNWKQKFVNFVRSNLFIPDPRKGWNKYAYKKALEVIQQHQIKNIITTSPPHSTQLIGLKLKKKLKDTIKWIADFRDPWTDIYYYELLQHSFLSHRINKNYEKKVLEYSDFIITVGSRFQSSFLSKTEAIAESKFAIITNGFDAEDFDNIQIDNVSNSIFTITYTGTISDYYQPEVFFRALGQLIKKYPDVPIQFIMVGMVSENIKNFIIDQIGDAAIFHATVTHDKAIEYMLRSNMLLLITQGEEGTIPGKTFEYLASQRRILCIGKGDASKVISECEAGESFYRKDEDAIFLYLESSLKEFIAGQPFHINSKELHKHSREYQANQVKALFK